MNTLPPRPASMQPNHYNNYYPPSPPYYPRSYYPPSPPRGYYPPSHASHHPRSPPRSPSPRPRMDYPRHDDAHPRYDDLFTPPPRENPHPRRTGYIQVGISPIRRPLPPPSNFLRTQRSPSHPDDHTPNTHPPSEAPLPPRRYRSKHYHRKSKTKEPQPPLPSSAVDNNESSQNTSSFKSNKRSHDDTSTNPGGKRVCYIDNRLKSKRQRSESPDPNDGERRPSKRNKGDEDGNDGDDECGDTTEEEGSGNKRGVNTGAASRLGVEPLTKIFRYLYEDTIGQRLCKMPLDARKAGTVVTNKRLTHGEMETYKKMMKKRLMLDMSMICKGWFEAAGEVLKGEFFVIGEKDAERAIANPKGWFPLNTPDYSPMQLTIQCSLPTVIRLFEAIHTAAEQYLPQVPEGTDELDEDGPPEYRSNFLPGPIPPPSYNPRDLRRARKSNGLLVPLQKLHKSKRPLPLKRLTILHSFQPETLNGIPRERFYNALSLVKPQELHFEWFAGETILTADCINKVADRLRVPLTSEELSSGVVYHYPEVDNDDEEDAFEVDRTQAPPVGADPKSWHYVKSVREGPDMEKSEYDQFVMYREQQFLYADPVKRRTWKAANQMGSVMMREIIGDVWRAELKKVDVRANWMDLCKTFRVATQHNGLEDVTFRYVPLIGRAFRRAVQSNTVQYHAPPPPLGSLKSLDNILMWDLRGRDPKWKRRRDHKAAKAAGNEYVEPPRKENFTFTVLAPYDLWKQQKDRTKFKGQGKQAAFALDFNEQMYAMRNYMLEKGKKWVRPDGFDEQGYNIEWTEKKTFEALIEFVTTKSRAKPRPRAKIKGHLLSITGGAFVDAEWIIKHMDRQGRLAAWEASRMARNEEEEMNDPDPVKRQELYNFDYMMRWLVEKGSDGRRDVLEQLRMKYGAKDLWEKCNWGLKHDAFPGMELRVQVVPK